MKNLIPKIGYYLVSLFFFLLNTELRATEFGSGDWDVSYNTCGGYMEVNILYYDKEGTNDWMEWMYLYYKKSNGDYQQVLAWANDDNYNIDGHCCSDVTDGTPFIYDINSPNTWSFFYVEFSDNDLVKMKIRIYNLPSDLIGSNVTMRINGFWHGGGTDSDVSISNWEKTAATTSINTPTGLTASMDEYCERVHLSWTNPQSNPCPSGNWEVLVYRDNVYIGTGGKNGYFDDYGATKSVTHAYKVRALFQPNSYVDNYSAYTDPPVNGRVISPLAPPNNVSASTDRCDGKILVQWVWPGSNPVNFLIERSTNPSSGFTQLSSTIDGGARSYLDMSSVLSNTNYYYRLKAKNTCSEWSITYSATISPAGIAAGIPAEPTNVTATPDTNKIKVGWTDNAVNESGFIIERTFTGGGAALIIEVPANTTMYTDLEVNLCVTYKYKIKAKSACYALGNGTKSAQTMLTPMLSETYGPNALQASKGYFTDKIQLEWANNNENIINKHKIYRRILGSLDSFSLLASENSGSNIYVDQFSEAGVLYEYRIQAEGLCEATTVYSNTSEAIGFRTKTGTVTGQVTYSGGIAVKDVKISSENTSGNNGKSLLFSGGQLTVSNSPSLILGSDLILETWIRPTSYAANFTVFEKVNCFSLKFIKASNEYRLMVYEGPAINATLNISNSNIPLNNFSHLLAQVTNDSLQLFVNGVRVASQAVPANFLPTVNINETSDNLTIGSAFLGNLDEIRIWNMSKTKQKIVQDFARIVSGGEPGLALYLRMNEGLGSWAYDGSKNGTLFNKNHALFSGMVSWSSIVPTTSQLSSAGYTDASGNYTIVIPYNGAGEVFVLTPSYLTHEFNPSTTGLFIGDGASVHNNINFIDKSSFRVQGTLNYLNTSCGVGDAFIKIDGDLLIVNGTAAKTDPTGAFDVQVPIGEHFIQAEQPGHVYSINRFPASGKYDFQDDLAGISFIDSTLIKVVGRVVGGLREASKIPGLGKSKNNIGIAKIILVSQQGGGCSKDTIYTDPLTGEYETFIPPLKYIPSVQIVNNPSINFGVLSLLDLSGTPILTTKYDTVFNGQGVVVSVDSIQFHRQLDYIYRVDPQITVYDKDGLSPFIGDSIYTHTNNVTMVTTTRNLRTDPFRWPVFHQGDENFQYRCLIKVYESYTNFDMFPNLVDSVPTTDGTLKFDNELSHLPIVELDLSEVNTLDTLKTLIYTFKPGTPNFIENLSIPEYSYTRKFEINLITSGGMSIPWLPVPVGMIPTGGDATFHGYLLGTQSKGAQFVTFGPQVPEYILRDPPGSASSATRSIGTTKSEITSWKWNLGAAVHTKDYIYVGAKFTAGFGVLLETDVESNVSAGFKAEIGGGNNGTQSVVTTNTREWSTYGGKVISPGANSDLYIGKSKNLQFGVAEELAIIPDGLCTDVQCIGGSSAQPGGAFSFAKKYGLSVVPGGYQTQFIFNEYDIKNFTIPNLQVLRNLMLQTNIKYLSKLPISDPNYGKNNDDKSFGLLASTQTPFTGDYADLDGPSYKYNAINLVDSLNGDSVRLINNQIRLWTEAIRLNEWEKVNVKNQTAIDSLKQIELDKLDEEYSEVKAAYYSLIVANGLGGIVIAYGLIAIPVPGTAFAGYATFALTTGTGIALAEIFEEFETYLALKQRIEDKFASLGSPTNYTLTGGTSLTSSMSHQTASSYTQSVEYATTANLLLEVKGKISNNGVGFEKGIEMKFTSGRDWTHEEDSTETVSYKLDDPDIGDLYSVDVFPSILGWGPIFKNKAGGATSCPHEPETKTVYYNPGTIISERTLQIDKPVISASPTIQTNIPVDEAAVFNLTLGNESENGFINGFTVDVVGATNPFGAIVLIDGFPFQNVIIPGGASINKVLTIQKGPGAVYNYDNILVTIHSQCQYTGGAGFNTDIVDSVYLSAHFLPSCSKTSLAFPEDKWVLNNSFNDTMPVAIVDYNINFFDLENLRFDYKPSSSPNWIGLETFYKDTTGLGDPNAKPIPQNTPFTLYDWDVSQLTDGAYDLRVVSNCALAEKVSETHSGIIDRINPHAFGAPSPADGILSPNDEISIKFNEPIDLGSINPAFNFDIRGIVNGTDVDHATSLLFDGIDDCMTINGGVPLDNRDFTIELSIKRASLGQQIILSQGVDVNERISLSFDANNKLVFTINNSTVTSTTAINDFNWHYIALSYNYKTETATMYLADAATTATVINTGATSILAKYIGSSNMIIGKNSVATQPVYPFKGNIHELRIWSKARSLAEFSLYKSKLLAGTEAGLLFNWRMDEASGNLSVEHLKRRDAIINGPTWQISPNGFAADFTAATAYAKASTANIAITDEMDFTLEFWFKSNQAGVASLFSNGTGDGLQSDSLVSWNIEKDAAGMIHIKHNKVDFVATTKNYFDGSWHHMALVMKREGNLSVYMDGLFESSMLATNFRQLSGACMYLGAKGSTIAQTETVNNYFKGGMDEFRFWNLSRTSEQILRDKQNRMIGDELGLEMYLPFEAYTKDPSGIHVLSQTFIDQALVKHTITPNGATLVNVTPTIKIQRPIRRIAFDYSVNNDQIILTPTTAPELIENVTLDITVEGIKDLHGNVMESPVTWIAYIDKNQVVWQDQLLVYSITRGDNLAFSSAIYNRGGQAKKFDIVDIPSWLTVTPTTGTIAPNSVIPVNFKIDPLINLGQYNVNLGLLTDFNYKEKLSLDLKVKAKEPDWAIDPSKFENTMSIIGQLKINGVWSTDVNDKLMVMVGQEIRGIANVEYVPQIDNYRVFLNIYSNLLTGEALTFRVWDASGGKIYSDVTVVPANLTFEANSIVGTLIDPKIFQTNANVSYEFPIKKGWNWLSFFLTTPNPLDLGTILASVAINGDQIKNRDAFANYNGTLWTGSLVSGGTPYGIRPESMYKLYKSVNDTLVLKGTVTNPTLKPITLTTGWTWLGFISIRQQSVAQALGGLNPAIGDVIKSKTNFAMYNGVSLGWVGSLKTLVPGEGYMYKSNATPSKTFYFPIAGMFDNLIDLTVRTGDEDYWEVDHSAYFSNMTIISEAINPCTETFKSGQYGLGFKDASGSWRGKAPFEQLYDKDYGFITIAGDQEESLDAYLIDKKTDISYNLKHKLLFKSNDALGSIDFPYLIEIPKSICEKLSTEENKERFSVYPHIFEDQIHMEYNAIQADPTAIIKISNFQGKVLFVKQIDLNEGFNLKHIDVSKLDLVPSGYIFELITSDKQKSQTIFKTY